VEFRTLTVQEAAEKLGVKLACICGFQKSGSRTERLGDWSASASVTWKLDPYLKEELQCR
jgi:hypothetical protein